jgi:hypothetical protein
MGGGGGSIIGGLDIEGFTWLVACWLYVVGVWSFLGMGFGLASVACVCLNRQRSGEVSMVFLEMFLRISLSLAVSIYFFVEVFFLFLISVRNIEHSICQRDMIRPLLVLGGARAITE